GGAGHPDLLQRRLHPSARLQGMTGQHSRSGQAAEDPQRTGTTGQDREPAGSPGPTRRSGRGRSVRAQLLIGLMSVLLGLGIVAQVRQTEQDEFSSLRQDDLVRLMSEMTDRNQQLTDE